VEAGNPAEARLRDLMASERLRVIDLTDPTATVQMLHALRSGEIVAMQGDRVFGAKAVEVPFFERATRFPAGPFHLAWAAGVPVLVGLVVRTGWLRYRMMIGPTLRLDPESPRDEAVRGALLQAVSFLEAHLRRWPCQWLNFFEFWPAAAEAEAAGEAGRSPCPGTSPSR
jgi:predicted LPLAT superfamily acyltransferase